MRLFLIALIGAFLYAAIITMADEAERRIRTAQEPARPESAETTTSLPDRAVLAAPFRAPVVPPDPTQARTLDRLARTAGIAPAELRRAVPDLPAYRRFEARLEAARAALRAAEQVASEAARPVVDRKDKAGEVETIPAGPIRKPDASSEERVVTRISRVGGVPQARNIRVRYGDDPAFDKAENARRDAELAMAVAVGDAYRAALLELAR